MQRISKRDLPRMYKEQLFANEVMLMPYYIAALNIEHAYLELTGRYAPFEGLCFVDTLDLAEDRQLPMFSEANTERVDRERKAQITVIIGNPPYNVGQLNENDNNKNRKYPVIDRRIHDTYAKDSKATLKNKLSDAYVKFFRWATDRLEGRDGVVCFVSNNSFVDQIAFDGMRKHLMQDFTHIDHIDLHGNVRRNLKLSGTAHNVFGIQVGVGITVAVRCSGEKRLRYLRVPEFWRKEEKLAWVDKRKVGWQKISPDRTNTWLVPSNAAEYDKAVAIGEMFEEHSLGVSSNRDGAVYGFDRASLEVHLAEFIEAYNSEVDRYRRSKRQVNVDDFVRYDKIKWSRDLKLKLRRGNYTEFEKAKLRIAQYRPFTKMWLFLDRVLLDQPGHFPRIFPPSASAGNRIIAVSQIGYRAPAFNTLVSACIPDLHLCASVDGHQCFPFYTYSPDGSNRRENITDAALEKFREHYRDPAIAKWDIFHYIYAVLHHPAYREKFADNLKRELPRIPFAPDLGAFAAAGRELARLHVEYETLDPWPLEWVENPAYPLSYRVEDRMRLNKDKTALAVNPSLTLAGIPPATFEYRLGNRSALEWVVDQYRVTEDERSGIKSDPNREDDPQYIVRLVGQVVRVSIETVGIVRSLPPVFPG
jgi:predicted helicase